MAEILEIDKANNATNNLEQEVEWMAALGYEADKIARMIGLRSGAEVRKKYKQTLDTSEIKHNCRVARALYDLATTGKNTTAMMFWLKCRAGWDPAPSNSWSADDVDIVFGNCERVD